VVVFIVWGFLQLCEDAVVKPFGFAVEMKMNAGFGSWVLSE